jgi:hypothetical protein
VNGWNCLIFTLFRSRDFLITSLLNFIIKSILGIAFFKTLMSWVGLRVCHAIPVPPTGSANGLGSNQSVALVKGRSGLG